MNKSYITDLFFDLDHTLWDFETNSELAFTELLKYFNISIHIQDFLEVYKPINTMYWVKYSENKITADELKTRRLSDTFKHFSTHYEHQKLEEMSKVYLDKLVQYNFLFEDALPTLNYLKEKYQMHIITNGFTEEQYVKINKSGLSTYFRTITTSDDVGVKKPDPQIFKEALKKANSTAEKSIMIGDNFNADIVGATNIGMDAIHYDFHKEAIPSHFKQIRTLSELKNIL